MPSTSWSFGRREIRMGDKKEGTMREVALCLGFRRARYSARDELCGLALNGRLATRTDNPTTPRSCLSRSLRLFQFPRETLAQADWMLRSARPDWFNTLVQGWSPLIAENLCGGWAMTAGHLLLVNGATDASSATSHCEPRPSSTGYPESPSFVGKLGAPAPAGVAYL
jgi:hypothetical protein